MVSVLCSSPAACPDVTVYPVKVSGLITGKCSSLIMSCIANTHIGGSAHGALLPSDPEGDFVK